MIDRFLRTFDALPLGCFRGTADRHRYRVTRSDHAGQASHKLVAEELGGDDYISLNLYRLSSGAQLKPCENVRRQGCGLRSGVTDRLTRRARQ